jgi:hypothetical protein
VLWEEFCILCEIYKGLCVIVFIKIGRVNMNMRAMDRRKEGFIYGGMEGIRLAEGRIEGK